MDKHESRTTTRVLASTALALALLSAGTASPLAAQQADTSAAARSTAPRDDNDGFDWGLLGLLGLGGLAGLRRRDHVERVDRVDTSARR
jgi:MYXO-CTERM domain-containing protein